MHLSIEDTKVTLQKYPKNPFMGLIPLDLIRDEEQLEKYFVGLFSGFFNKKSEAALNSIIWHLEIVNAPNDLKVVLEDWILHTHKIEGTYLSFKRLRPEQKPMNLTCAINHLALATLFKTHSRICSKNPDVTLIFWKIWKEIRDVHQLLAGNLMPNCFSIGFCDLEDVSIKHCDLRHLPRPFMASRGASPCHLSSSTIRKYTDVSLDTVFESKNPSIRDKELMDQALKF